MVEIYAEKGCVGCMRSSPVASMLGLITILFGIGAFSGGLIIYWKSVNKIINYETYLPIQYIMYGTVSIVVVYSMLCYLLAALSSGHNRKRFFEGSKKAKIGRCFTIFNIFCLMITSLLWILVSCVAAYCLIVTCFIHNRINMSSNQSNSIDLSYYTLINQTVKIENDAIPEIFLSISCVTGGSLVIVMGFIHLLCCSAMNFVRLSEERYYDDFSATQIKSEHVLSAF